MMKFKRALPLLLLLSLLTVSCNGTMMKNSGFSIYARGYKNAYETSYVANSIEDITKYCSETIFEHYSGCFVKLGFAPVKGTYVYSIDNMFNILELDTHLNTYLAVYDTSGKEIQDIKGNEKVYLGYTLQYEFDYCFRNAASSHCKQSSENVYMPITNANTVIRQSEMKSPRDESFNNFPLMLENKGTLKVYNSEELWWCVNNNYLPEIPGDNYRVYDLWQNALKINRKIISDDMDDFTKLLAIYEYIASEIRYDHDATEVTDWVKDTAFYLEGSLIYNTAVCDSFSKLFNLLAGIENLDTKRGFGYASDSGHAWNYASLDGNKYYLCCPTWGRCEAYLVDDDKLINFCNYEPFMTKASYFKDYNPQQDFAEYIYPNLNKMNSYLPVFSEETYQYNDQTYDFVINSENDLKAIFAKCKSLNLENKFYVSFQGSTDFQITKTNLLSAIKSAGYSGVNVYAIHENGYYLNQYHKLGNSYYCYCIY